MPFSGPGLCEKWGIPMRYKIKAHKRGQVRDNSRNLAVRMGEADFQLLQRYEAATGLPSTTYFRKLIAGEQICVRPDENVRGQHKANNMIYSNVRQILRAARQAGMTSETLGELWVLISALSREVSKLAFLR